MCFENDFRFAIREAHRHTNQISEPAHQPITKTTTTAAKKLCIRIELQLVSISIRWCLQSLNRVLFVCVMFVRISGRSYRFDRKMFLKQFHMYNIFANTDQKLWVVHWMHHLRSGKSTKEMAFSSRSLSLSLAFFVQLCLLVCNVRFYTLTTSSSHRFAKENSLGRKERCWTQGGWSQKKVHNQRKRMAKSKTNRWKAEIVHFISVMQFVSIEWTNFYNLALLVHLCVCASFFVVFVGSASAEQHFHVVNAVSGRKRSLLHTANDWKVVAHMWWTFNGMKQYRNIRQIALFVAAFRLNWRKLKFCFTISITFCSSDGGDSNSESDGSSSNGGARRSTEKWDFEADGSKSIPISMHTHRFTV